MFNLPPLCCRNFLFRVIHGKFLFVFRSMQLNFIRKVMRLFYMKGKVMELCVLPSQLPQCIRQASSVRLLFRRTFRMSVLQSYFRLRQHFAERLIFKSGERRWPAQSSDSAPCNFFSGVISSQLFTMTVQGPYLIWRTTYTPSHRQHTRQYASASLTELQKSCNWMHWQW
jgi:hypothetical protein